MATVLDDLGAYLSTALGTSWTVGGNIFLGTIPDSVDTCISLIETLTFEPIDTFGTTAGDANLAKIERPQIQVISRATQHDYETARTNSELAYKQLHGTYKLTQSGTLYLAIIARSTPHYQGEDNNSRHMITFTLDVWKEPNS
jgi:hypothetical protein